jgi:hypothetical protein
MAEPRARSAPPPPKSDVNMSKGDGVVASPEPFRPNRALIRLSLQDDDTFEPKESSAGKRRAAR